MSKPNFAILKSAGKKNVTNNTHILPSNVQGGEGRER